jgi:hypothetical protein
MNFVLSDGISFCKKWVNNGSCNNTTVINRINEATQHLMNPADQRWLMRRIKIWACNSCIALPREFQTIKAVSIDHIPANTFSQYYEFMPGGPGRIDEWMSTSGVDLIDFGSHWPTFSDIPCDEAPLKLLAFSKETADTNQTIFAKGKDTNLAHILTNGTPGTTIPVNRWTDGIEGQIDNWDQLSATTVDFRTLDYIRKPVTAGYVTLYAWDSTTYEMWYLSKYHPDETTPSYQRYRISNLSTECGQYVVGFARLAYVPAKHDDDILIIQSLPALKAMCQALQEYDDKNMDEGAAYEDQARTLLEQLDTAEAAVSNELNVEDMFGLGDVQTLI